MLGKSKNLLISFIPLMLKNSKEYLDYKESIPNQDLKNVTFCINWLTIMGARQGKCSRFPPEKGFCMCLCVLFKE